MRSIQDRHQPQPRLLMHACCGPCSLEPTRILQERGFSPAIYYANSNIDSQEEHDQRLETLKTWAASEEIQVTSGPYDSLAWEQTAGRIGQAAYEEALAQTDLQDPGQRAAILRVDPEKRKARCRACYRIRLEEAAQYAKKHGFEALGTTLTVSIYQYVDVIREELERACTPLGLRVEFDDFRPQFDEAERRSKKLGMYRQNYCGCRFSKLEAEAERAERRQLRKAQKAAKRAEQAQQIAAEERQRNTKKAEKQAYAEKQRQKRAILKAMREQAQQE